MRNSLLILIAFLNVFPAPAQSSGGFEQLYYMRATDGASLVPMAHYTTKNNWYGEARYNYDEAQTFSVYAGRTFSRKGLLSCSATPLLGGLMGKMNGGSVGMNMDLGFENLFFSTQSQYTFSLAQKTNKYFFSWSELGYQATSWLYGGMALQQTNIYQTAGKFEPGCMLGFSLKNWTVPLYVFNQTGGDAY
ncbi:MAG: hypothetical protein H0X41_09875, partial [Chitinophagaceae bacterium]|nr:hypothetical protein [Chitinophagaceae bacterium]